MRATNLGKNIVDSFFFYKITRLNLLNAHEESYGSGFKKKRGSKSAEFRDAIERMNAK